jgi:hypothetical protein
MFYSFVTVGVLISVWGGARASALLTKGVALQLIIMDVLLILLFSLKKRS